MSDNRTSAQNRLQQVKDFLSASQTATTIPFNPDSTKFPSRKDVPLRPGAPEGAAWVWGEDDNVSLPGQRVNAPVYS